MTSKMNVTAIGLLLLFVAGCGTSVGGVYSGDDGAFRGALLASLSDAEIRAFIGNGVCDGRGVAEIEILRTGGSEAQVTGQCA